MSAEPDPFAAYRPLVVEAVRAALTGLKLSHAELLRQQFRLDEAFEVLPSRFTPASLCLLTAEALGGETPSALAAATALAFLEAMSDVFRDLAAPTGADGLRAAWGMPRALNAGDALFALAQRSLLQMRGGGDETRLLLALSLLDGAGRALSESFLDVQAEAFSSGQPLIRWAVALGALAAGASCEIVTQLSAFGRSASDTRGVATALTEVELPEEAKRRLVDAVSYIAQAGGL